MQIRQFHVLGDLSKPQTWNNTLINKLSPCRRPRIVNNPGSERKATKLEVICSEDKNFAAEINLVYFFFE